ncbi:hypothetical protein Hanom_Chr12g01179731 [Helianthus anomalus]
MLEDQASALRKGLESKNRYLKILVDQIRELIKTFQLGKVLLPPVAKLEISDRGVENVYTQNFYTKTTYSPLLSEKFGGSDGRSPPLCYAHGCRMRVTISLLKIIYLFNNNG